VTQACLAIHGLAVKVFNDKVHKPNTKKFVAKGAIEVVIAVMQKYPANDEVQSSCALAISSLGRLPDNRDKIGACGAIELILASMNNHAGNENVIGKLALAVDVLSQGSELHRDKFAAGGAAEIILHAIHKHEKNISVVIGGFRALVVLSSAAEAHGSKSKIRSEASFRQIVKSIKSHSADELVCKWGCTLLCSIASDDSR